MANEHTTICDFIKKSASLYPDKTALIFEGQSLLYGDLNRRVDEFSGLLQQSRKQGDIIALLLPNSVEFIIAYFAILNAGCTVLLLPHNVSDEALLFQIQKTGAQSLITSRVLRDKVSRVGLTDKLELTFVEELPDKLPPYTQRSIGPDDVALILFTSGTTTTPKGVRLLHRNVVAATRNIVSFLGFTPNDIDVNISALSHSFGLGHVHCVFSTSGTEILFRDAVNLRKILDTIVEAEATTFGAVPAILTMLMEHYKNDLAQCSNYLRFVQTNTSQLDPLFIQQILDTMPHTDFCYYYGLTEASRATFINFRKHPNKLGSVGQPTASNVEIRIVDESGVGLESGQIGEIAVKGDMVISEYFENAEASKRIKDEFLLTGDAGYLDNDGFLYFTGRKDDIINVAGEKVNPEEIEAVIKVVPGVLDVAVVGVKDNLLGEVPKAYVVAATGLSVESIMNACKRRLERFKVPKTIEMVQEIPKTSNGKIRRNVLRQQHEHR